MGNRSKVKNLAKDFVANRVSAAGISYILNRRTRLRRVLWLLGVAGCITFMGYMTFEVISEYLRYPKMLMREDIIMSKLPFPAVTVCSLNPVSERFSNHSFLRKHLKLRELLQSSLPLQPRSELKLNCMAEALCEWSWFLETCVCVSNPCETEFCLSHNDSHCLCSSAICRSDKLSCSRLPGNQTTQNICACETDDTFLSPLKRIEPMKLEDILPHISDGEVREIIRLVWESNSFDLSDIEEGLMPTMDEMYEYGITFDSLVASCSFEMDKCHRDNFTVLYHPMYGKCYMFNYVGGEAMEDRIPVVTHSYGSNSGLRLLLRVTDEEVLDLVRREVGARIVVHDPNHLPFVAESGLNLRPLDMTAVDVSMATMSRLSSPWGNCVSGKHIGNEPYSILGCEKECGLKYMTQECNCTVRHLLHGSALSKKMTSYPFCNLSHEQEKNCVEKVQDELERKMVDCRCNPPCNETIYSYSVTSSELNGNYYKTVKAIRTFMTTGNGTLAYINATDQKSMIGVKVYYNTFQVSKQFEVASYSWETLIANVGGNLGFFMGLTLVTFLEVLEFLWDVLVTACRHPEENKVCGIDCIKVVLPKVPQKSESFRSQKKVLQRRRSKTVPLDNVNFFFCRSIEFVVKNS